MLKTGKTFCFISLLFFMSSVAMAESVEVKASIDRPSVDPGEPFTLTVSIENLGDNDVGQPTLPPMGDFEVIGQSSFRENRHSLEITPQGKPRFVSVDALRINYVLLPKRQGKLTVDPIEVVVNGKTVMTKPISVEVSPGAGAKSRPRAGGGGGGGWPPAFVRPPPGFDDEDDPFSQMLRGRTPPMGAAAGGSRTLPINPNEAFFIQVETDKNEAYVGEQITVSWYLYTRGTIRDLDTLKYPSLKGFWKEDIEIATHLNFTQEIVNDLPYKKALLASFALFPIKEGTAIIDSYTAKCSVIPSMEDLGLGFGKAYSFTKSSQPVRVTVKPLPTEGRPADFSGAVGDFQVTARVEDNNVIAHQPFSFKIRFEGRGNAKTIDIPPFQVPEGMELYDTQKEAKFFRTGTSYKDFNLLLIPRREGEFTIPPVSVSIFDPEQKRYVTKTTEAVVVHVAPGKNPSTAGQGMSVGGGEDEKETPKAPMEPQEPRLQTLESASGVLRLTPAQKSVGYGGFLVVILLALFWQARQELGWGQRRKDLMRQIKGRLKKVHTRVDQGDWRGVGVEMTNTVYFVLGAISGEGGANVELEKLLMKAPPSVRRELAEPLKKQMETLQVLSFAPESVVGNLKERDQLKRIIADGEKLIERAVALGVSSGQSDVFESSPTTS